MAQGADHRSIYDSIDATDTPSGLDDMTEEEAVEAVKEWFFENFADPAENTPHESAEGGYQYIWGGPFDAEDVLLHYFSEELSDDVRWRVVEELNRMSGVWAPNLSRIRDADEMPPEEQAAHLHDQMLQAVSELEILIKEAEGPPVGIGHNYPPEPIESAPLTADDLREVMEACATLKQQLIEPPDGGKAAQEAAEKIKSKREKIKDWLLKQGDAFVTEAVKEAGKQFGIWAPRALWLLIVDRMFGVTEAVASWLHVVQKLF